MYVEEIFRLFLTTDRWKWKDRWNT